MTAAAFHTARHTDATLQVGRWPAYLYSTRLTGSTSLRGAVETVSRAFVARAPRSADSAAEQRRQADLAGCLGREVFASLYGADEVVPLAQPAAGTEMVSKAHGVLQGLQEFKALQAQVHGDPDLAALAAAQLLRGVAQALPAVGEQEKKQAQEAAQAAAGGRAARGPAADAEGALRRALRAACTAAQQVQADARVALEGLQPGLAATPPVHQQDDGGRLALAERVSADPRLRRVMQLAGRLQRLAAEGKKERDELGCSTLVGVTIGGDLQRALPTELGLLRHPRLRRVQLAKLADRRLQQYHVVGETPKGRGPVVVLLDESSSMSGDRSLWASAVALACLGVARREKRACTVIGFNGGLRYCVRLDAQGTGWNHPVTRGSVSPEATRIGTAADVALHVATSGTGGGTSFDPPLRAALALEDGVVNERADLVLVTDGHATASPDTQAQLTEAKAQRGLRMFGLTVGGGSLGHAVRQLCDSTVDLDDAIGRDGAKEVAGAIP